MYALSIRQPWASLIVDGTKAVENRSRRTHIRGPILIHASKALDWKELNAAMTLYLHEGIRWNLPAICEGAHSRSLGIQGEWVNQDGSLVPHGGIIGIGWLSDCVTSAKDLPKDQRPWFKGPFGWVFDRVEPLPFFPCKGALGFFRVQPPVEWLATLSPEDAALLR